MRALLALAAVLHATQISAYEVRTHRQMGVASAAVSDLDAYLEGELLRSPLQVYRGPAEAFPPLPFGNESNTAAIWISRGCELEDTADLLRPLNHFYNPLDQTGLWTLLGFPSPDWALETFSGSQDWSLPDARDAFYEALTATTPLGREDGFARTFRSLGQLAHLIQDMAQPQHARNDAHLGLAVGGVAPGGESSLFEVLTEELVDASSETFRGYPPVYGELDRTTFTTPRRFWDTGTGLGLAEFSNREFVSQGTNFIAAPGGAPLFEYLIAPHPDFQLPNGAEASIETVDAASLDLSAALHGEIDFIVTPVDDLYLPGASVPAVRTSSYSIFDPDLEVAGEPLTFTLNRFNFEDHWPILLPRAIGYGAGLINHFFRGRLELSPVGVGDALRIRNRHDEAIIGDFEIFYDRANGTRQRIGPAWSLALGAAGSVGDDAVVTAVLPDDAGPADLTLVARGAFGTGDPAVVAKVVREPFWLYLSTGLPFTGYPHITAHRSLLLDRGWQLRSELIGPLPPGFPSALSGGGGCVINDDLAFISGERSAVRVEGGGSALSFVDPWELFDPDPFVESVTHLGGTELLATYASLLPTAVFGSGTRYSNDLGETWVDQPHDLLTFETTFGLTTDQTLAYIGNGNVLMFTAGPPGTRGLYRSNDAGLSWEELSTVVVDGETLPGCFVSPGVIPDPDPGCRNRFLVQSFAWNHVEGPGSRILARALRLEPPSESYYGLWLSSDSGNSWVRVPQPAGYEFNWLTAAIAPSGEIIAGAIVSPVDGEPFMRLFRTDDLGENWQEPAVPSDGACLPEDCLGGMTVLYGGIPRHE